MGGCSAVRCSGHSKNRIRLFRFPADAERRRKWTINCGRDGWVPGPRAELCIAHFEESQFEQNRADGWKKLKQNAVPTLFEVSNPPAVFANRRVKGKGSPAILNPEPQITNVRILSEQNRLDVSVNQSVNCTPEVRILSEQNRQLDLPVNQSVNCTPETSHDTNALLRRIAELEENYNKVKMEVESKNLEIEELKDEVKKKNRSLSFLSEEQINYAGINQQLIKHWSNASIIKGLKLRFALGKFGYSFLRSTGYPAPSYSTLNRRLQGIPMGFGVLHKFLEILSVKVKLMDRLDKFCAIGVDEMEISANPDFDVSTKSFVGNTTLGKTTDVGNHYTVVLLRGLKTPWKQIVAHEITGPSTTGEKMNELMSSTIEAVQQIGLNVKASVSDMGSSNKSMWKSFGVYVSRNERQTTFTAGSETIHSVADVPHLLKNMRGAILSRMLILPQDICLNENLPSRNISSGYIKYLWIEEIKSSSGLRSLHHLSKRHLFPSHFSSMNVATAVQFFSVKTAAALEKAVSLKQVPQEALTTAWFVRLMHQWFQLMTARHQIRGITLRNKDEKFSFLQNFIYILQNMLLGKGWKPLQTGMIMSTLSVVNLSESLFSEGFSYVLPGRLTQDALENVFSQIRRKSASKPTALQAKRALKLICVSQFISDLKNTNYSTESDCHLLDYAKENIEPISPVTVNTTNSLSTASSSSSTPSLKKIIAEENNIYYIASATVHGVMKRKLCAVCTEALLEAEDYNEPDVPRHRTYLNEYCNMGGLKEASSGIYRICREAERCLQMHKASFLKSETSVNADFLKLIVHKCENVPMPTCCNLKEKIIEYYLIVRCKGIKNHLMNQKMYSTVTYGSASASKKK